MRLTPDQINKLGDRNNLEPKPRRDNEFAVRNRLKEFLEFIGDANYIINHLPREQLRKSSKLNELLTDYTVQEAFELVLNLLDLMGWGIISGSAEKPYIVSYHGNVPDGVRPATEHDLNRNLMVRDYVLRMSDYYTSDVNRLAEYEANRAKNIKWKKLEVDPIAPVIPHEIDPDENASEERKPSAARTTYLDAHNKRC